MPSCSLTGISRQALNLSASPAKTCRPSPILHMASARIASGVHGFGLAAFSSQNEAVCCIRRGRLPNVRFSRGLHCHNGCCGSLHSERTKARLLNAISDGEQPSGNEDDDGDDDSAADGFSQVNHDAFRKNLESIIGDNDASFCGKDLAMLIRNKYGRSYDVQLIKKEFMGRQLLAMNVMWKYREQRSFPLTEEEYLLRLDDVANNLRCWGAVSYVRNSLAKTKDRPRIGKAVSIFIDLDESGGRANEWIYR